MDFFEFVWLFSLTVALPLVIFKSVMDLKRQRLEAEAGRPEGAGLTVGELKRALREVVEEANAPVHERLDALERVALPEPRAELEVEEPGEVDEVPPKSVGRRVQG